MEAAAAAAAPVSASIVEKAAKESHLAVYPLQAGSTILFLGPCARVRATGRVPSVS